MAVDVSGTAASDYVALEEGRTWGPSSASSTLKPALEVRGSFIITRVTTFPSRRSPRPTRVDLCSGPRRRDHQRRIEHPAETVISDGTVLSVNDCPPEEPGRPSQYIARTGRSSPTRRSSTDRRFASKPRRGPHDPSVRVASSGATRTHLMTHSPTAALEGRNHRAWKALTSSKRDPATLAYSPSSHSSSCHCPPASTRSSQDDGWKIFHSRCAIPARSRSSRVPQCR